METQAKKAITLMDKSTKGMTKIASEASKLMADLAIMADQYAEVAFDIELRAQELAEIDEKIKFKQREAEADLVIRVKENERKVLEMLLDENELAKIKKPELAELHGRIKDLETTAQKKSDEAVAQVTAKLMQGHDAHVAKLEAQHKVDVAELTANNKALSDKVAMLLTANEQLQEMLNAERQARVDMAKNQSQPTINFTGGK